MKGEKIITLVVLITFLLTSCAPSKAFIGAENGDTKVGLTLESEDTTLIKTFIYGGLIVIFLLGISWLYFNKRKNNREVN